jgi:hypothetical protein
MVQRTVYELDEPGDREIGQHGADSGAIWGRIVQIETIAR